MNDMETTTNSVKTWRTAITVAIVAAFTCQFTESVRAEAAQPEAAQPEAAQPEGDLATKWKVNESDPKSGIPSQAERNKDPMEFAYFLQDLASRAEGALQKQNWQDAVKYYEALGHAVPDAWVSFNRLCLAYGKLGKFEIAAGNCGKAVSLPMAKVIDHLRFIEYTLRGERFTERDVQNVEESLKHLRAHVALNPQPPPGQKPEGAASPDAGVTGAGSQPPRERTREELLAAIRARQEKAVLEGLADGKKEPAAPVMHLPTQIEHLTCKLAVRMKDAPRMQGCIDELRRLKVDEKQLLALSWVHALLAKDQDRAEDLLDKAESLGLPETTMASMKVQHAQSFPMRLLPRGWWPLGVAALLAIAGVIFVRARRKRMGGTAAA
jgi:tetratricopeptide (TPR) repeat protein